MPFASLQKVLQLVDPKCAFNVEIKYPQQKMVPLSDDSDFMPLIAANRNSTLKGGQWESEKTFDLNEYVDVIVSTVFEFGGKRNIMFSCFHPDICSM